MTHVGGGTIENKEDWLMSEVEREKRKIERHIAATERRQEQLAVRD